MHCLRTTFRFSSGLRALTVIHERASDSASSSGGVASTMRNFRPKLTSKAFQTS